MASKTVEIVLKASDQFTDTTKKAQLQFAAMTIAADDFNTSVKKLQNLHPGLKPEEVEAVARALENAAKGADQVNHSFTNANIAARGLAQEIGITLPRAVTQFLGQSALVGPALSAAFSVVAVVGMIEALGQLPALYSKLEGAITGWNATAQHAYAEFIKSNNDAAKATSEFHAALAGLTGGPTASTESLIADYQRALDQKTKQAAALREQAKDPSSYITGGFFAATNLNKEADRVEGQAKATATVILALQRQLDLETRKDAEETRVWFGHVSEEVMRNKEIQARKDAEILKQRTEAEERLQNQILESYDGIRRSEEMLLHTEQQREAAQERMIDTTYEMYNGIMEAEEILLRHQKERQALQDRMSEVTQEIIDSTAEVYRKLGEQHDKAVDTFREGLGKVWDEFFLKGKGIIGDIQNLFTGLAKSITKSIFQDVAMNVLFGAAGAKQFPDKGGGVMQSIQGLGALSGGGGLLGGILGKVVGKASSGPWSEAIPGLSGGGGLLGSLGGLFEKHAAIGTLNPATGALVPTGGLAGALGLGGGAGLLGLGAATIPVLGGIAAGAALIAMAIFGHHHDAPFTRDPNAIQNTREYLFYSGVQDFAKASKDMLDFTHNLNTLPTGTLVKQGLPVALASSNAFRRDVSATLLQDK